ncbi:pol protein [Cucumis melo var. makuwa]|uniref:Pol protein n=1 Tax=Cucumis melo var. makuwa TaxID=1194695 RepID=A0A5D3D7B5_CUCMM|nr:pol protein [Cucumis melo var. makuwa]
MLSVPAGLPRTLKSYTMIWVVADTLTKSAHFIPRKSTYTTKMPVSLPNSGKFLQTVICTDEVGEQRLMGPELVQFTNEEIHKIRARMQAAQSRQKSYADVRRKDLVFDVGDKVAPVKDPSHVVDYEPLEIYENLSYVEQPIEILAREAKVTRLGGARRIRERHIDDVVNV